MEANDRHDPLVAEVHAEDVLLTRPPEPMRFVGRVAILAFSADVFDPASSLYHLTRTAVTLHSRR